MHRAKAGQSRLKGAKLRAPFTDDHQAAATDLKAVPEDLRAALGSAWPRLQGCHVGLWGGSGGCRRAEVTPHGQA